MIPSILLIKSSKKRYFTITQKRNLQIGIHKDSDIIINHPHFATQTQALGQNSIKSKEEKGLKAKAHFILPIHTFKVDGLCVQLVRLKMIFYILFLLCTGIVPIIVLISNNSNHSVAQDWTPVILPANGIYGFCRQDRTHREGVNFRFEANSSQAYKLVFFPGGKGDGTFIKIFLNGSKIDKSLSLPMGWGNETSVPLPSSLIKSGQNTIKISPQVPAANPPSWGVSEVKIVQISRSSSNTQNITFTSLEEIKSALKNKDLGGKELAHFHNIVSTWDTPTLAGGSSFEIDNIVEEIQQRMKILLHQVAFEVRSNQILRDQSAVRLLLNETGNWIPESWNEGWEIYNELCQ